MCGHWGASYTNSVLSMYTRNKHPFNSDNLLALVYKIVQEEVPLISSYFSKELAALVRLLLTKDSDQRPTVSDILSMSFVRRYMNEFVQMHIIKLESKSQSKDILSITAQKDITIPSPHKLSDKERLRLKKEMEIKKREEELKNAAKQQLINNLEANNKTKKLEQIYNQTNYLHTPDKDSPSKQNSMRPQSQQIVNIEEKKQTNQLTQSGTFQGYKPSFNQSPQVTN